MGFIFNDNYQRICITIAANNTFFGGVKVYLLEGSKVTCDGSEFP